MDITITDYKRIVKFAARMRADHDVNIPLFIWGMHATGKTSATRQVAEEMGYHCEVLNLANQSPEDLLGNPIVNHKRKLVEFYAPEWFNRKISETQYKSRQRIEAVDAEIINADTGDTEVSTALVKAPPSEDEMAAEFDKIAYQCRTIYFLDEVNRAPKYVVQGMFNFVNEGRLHNHNITKYDIIIAAGNPNSAEYEVTDFSDTAWMSRFAHFILSPSIDEVITYLMAQKCSHIVLDMLKENPTMCDTNVDISAQVKIKPDYRMIQKIGHILEYIKSEEFDDFGYMLLSAMIGPDQAQIAETKYRQMNDMPRIEDVLNGNYDIEKLDINRLDIIQTLNSSIVAYLDVKGLLNGKFPVEMKPPLVKYIQHIPKDAAVAMVKEFRFRKKEHVALDIFDSIVPFLYQLYEVEKQLAKKEKKAAGK